MSIGSKWNGRRAAVCWLMGAAILHGIMGCGWRKAPDNVVEALPSTGNVCGMSQCILVSPDESWLVFYESAAKGGGTVDGVASIDLHDGKYTRYDLGQVESKDMPRSLSPIWSKLFYFLDGIERVGWTDEQLIMEFGGRGRGLYFLRDRCGVWKDDGRIKRLYVSDSIAYKGCIPSAEVRHNQA